MPMPALDATRFIAAVLADPSHELPLPDRGGRRFLAEGETVDSWDPFYAHLLADGSLKPKPAEIGPDVGPSGADHADLQGSAPQEAEALPAVAPADPAH